MDPLDTFILTARHAKHAIEIETDLRAAIAQDLAACLVARPEPWFFVAEPTLTVFATRGAPGSGSAPHDHGIEAIIGCLAGREGSRLYDLDRGDLREIARSELRAGDAHVVGPRAIHAVFNCWNEPNLVLHVYRGDFLATPKRVWDPITGSATTLGLGEPLAVLS